jgi:hypothetical protein
VQTLLIACRTLKDELELAEREAGVSHPTRWVEPGLDARPDKLREHLRAELDQVSGENARQATREGCATGRVLLAFGYCGHALLGLHATTFELIFPRADDCISLLLGSTERREAIAGETPTYFVTEGWLDHESNIWSDYQRASATMGVERARQAMAMLLAPYTRLGVIDSGACPLARVTGRTRGIAAALGLDHEVIPGSTRYLRQLLAGPWGEEFVTIPPGGAVTLDHLLRQDGAP